MTGVYLNIWVRMGGFEACCVLECGFLVWIGKLFVKKSCL